MFLVYSNVLPVTFLACLHTFVHYSKLLQGDEGPRDHVSGLSSDGFKLGCRGLKLQNSGYVCDKSVYEIPIYVFEML